MAAVLFLGAISGACRGPGMGEERAYRTLAPLVQVGRVVGDVRSEVQDEVSGVWIGTGGELELSVFAEAGTVLRTRTLRWRGGAARLRVEAEFDDGERDLDAEFASGARELHVDLELAEDAPVRLRLRVEGSGEAAVGGAWLGDVALAAPLEREAARASVAAVEVDGSPFDPQRAKAPPPHVLVYLIDTLRRDRLGCYGYDRPTSPQIDRFADVATLYWNAVAQSSWTKGSVGSLLTGVWPPEHGATGWKHRLPDRFVTLPEMFAESGYETAAFVTNPNILPVYGFDQGYDHFVKRLNLPSGELNELVFEWLAERESSSPWFLYVHSMDPHAPYAPPEPYRSQLAPDLDEMPTWSPRWRWPDEALPFLSNAYDAEIAANDASFGALLDHLRGLGLYDDTLIVLLSDHGEEFRDHGRWRHGNALFGESLDIPLVVKYPGQRVGERVERPVQQIDLAPTLLEVTGGTVPQTLVGRSLRAGDSAPVLSHLRLGRRPLQYSVVVGDWKLIRTHEGSAAALELYDRGRDRGELENVVSLHPVRAEAMSLLLDLQLADGAELEGAEEASGVDAELERELRSLGYLQ